MVLVYALNIILVFIDRLINSIFTLYVPLGLAKLDMSFLVVSFILIVILNVYCYYKRCLATVLLR